VLIAVLLGVVIPVRPGAAAEPVPGPKCASTQKGAPASTASGPIHVASFNVLHGLSEDPPAYPAHSTLDARVALAARELGAAGIDIVGMQEVSWIVPNELTKHRTTEVAKAFARALAADTGDRWYWCWYLANPHIPGEPDVQPGGGGPLSDQAAVLASQFVSPQYASFKEGLAVVSRYPIVAAEGMHLPGRLPAEIPLCFIAPADPEADPAGCAETAAAESRATLWARVDSPVGAVDISTTHLAHDITEASDFSSLQQAATALAFAQAHSADGVATHRFFVCDCNSQPSDEVPVIPTIQNAGWTNTFEGDCASDPRFCTAGPDVIVTPKKSRTMNERLDYVFWRAGACSSEPTHGRIIVDSPQRIGPGRYLWPSDHKGVATTVTGC
jgi:endonuclease/exonuclease/phosphatase family metal-dependent hydrolase